MKLCSILCRTASSGLLAGALTLLATTLPAAAQQAAAAKPEWTFSADLYLWGASMGTTTTTGDDMDIPFTDILSALDLAFMGGAQAHYGRLSLNADMLYMKLSQSADMNANLVGRPLSVQADVDVTAYVPTVFVAYTVLEAEKLKLDVLAGARYFRMDVGLDFGIDGAYISRERSISETRDVWDGIVGTRGIVDLSEKWYLPFYVDAGTGESSLTWQAFAGVGYRMTTYADLVVGYRYLYYDLDDSKVLDTLAMNGPLAGVRFRF